MDEIIEHHKTGARNKDKEVVVISGSSGLIGFSLIEKLAKKYRSCSRFRSSRTTLSTSSSRVYKL